MRDSVRRHHLHMAAFPALQASCLVGAAATLREEPALGLALAALSAVSLNFSLHITYHYYVHHPAHSPWVDWAARTLYSVLMGVPFHFYRTLHINHHIHDNAIDDATSTWRLDDSGKPARRNVWAYTLLWPFQRRARHLLDDAAAAGYFEERHRRKLGGELLAIGIVVLALAVLDWRLVGLYYGVFYVGWSLINLHNYGQHLPQERVMGLGNSFYGRLYNLVFVNNGLHYEHHKEPQIPYWELADLRDENVPNRLPHTVDGVRFSVAEPSGADRTGPEPPGDDASPR